MAAIAMGTSRIRVGSAGIMLPHYAPLKVAEQFRVLDALAPGRIDLGLGARPAPTGAPPSRCIRWPTSARRIPGRRDRPAGLGVRAPPCPPITPSARSRPTHRARRRPRSGSSAAPTTARRWRRISGCPTPSPGSSPTARAASRRSTLPQSSTSPARRIPSRTRRCACGRWRPTRRRRRGITSPRGPLPAAARPRHLRRAGDAGGRARPPYTPAEPARIAELRTRLRRHGRAGGGAHRGAGQAPRVQEMAVVTWATDETVRRRSYQLLAETMGFAPQLRRRIADSLRQSLGFRDDGWDS